MWRLRVAYNIILDIELQDRILPVRLGEAISGIFGSQVSLRTHYCKGDEVYFTLLL